MLDRLAEFEGRLVYGFALVSRERSNDTRYPNHLGIVTPSGRRMSLTGRLALVLIYHVAWLGGTVACGLTAREPSRTGKPPVHPLQELDVRMAAGPTRENAPTHTIQTVSAVIRPVDLEDAPLYFLFHRPLLGWPA